MPQPALAPASWTPYARTDRVIDCVVVFALGLAAYVLCYAGSALVDPRIVDTNDLRNVWFDADPSAYYVSMTNRISGHWGANVHPMLAFFMYTPTFAMTRGLGLSKPDAARAVMSLAAAIWVGATFVLARVLGCRQLDAALVSLLAATSAAAMFMFVVPEFHPFGGVTVVLCLIFWAVSRGRRFSTAWYVAFNALSAAATVTNWPLGVAIAFSAGGIRRAARVTAGGAVLLVALSAIQRLAFPTATPILWRAEGYAIASTEVPTPRRIIETTQAFFFHSVIMPTLVPIGASAARPVGSAEWPHRALSVQHSRPGSASVSGGLAVALWTILLASGALACFRDRGRSLVLPIALAGQWALYSIFGDETFLYALNWLPLLTAFVAAALVNARGIALRLVLIGLILVGGINNVAQFRVAVDMLSHPDRYPAMAVATRQP